MYSLHKSPSFGFYNGSLNVNIQHPTFLPPAATAARTRHRRKAPLRSQPGRLQAAAWRRANSSELAMLQLELFPMDLLKGATKITK